MNTSRRNFLGGLAAAGASVSPWLAKASAAAVGKPIHDMPINVLVHFADNDYSEVTMRHLKSFKSANSELLMRSYAYVDYNSELPQVFKKIHSSENRTQVINRCRVLVSCCPQAIAEACATGAKAVYLETDQTTAVDRSLIETLGATVVSVSNKGALQSVLRSV